MTGREGDKTAQKDRFPGCSCERLRKGETTTEFLHNLTRSVQNPHRYLAVLAEMRKAFACQFDVLSVTICAAITAGVRLRYVRCKSRESGDS